MVNKNTVIKKISDFFYERMFPPKIDYSIKTERFGSRYGGWDLVPGYINENSIIYSFGIGEDISFDRELINRFNSVVHAFDPTPKSIDWIKKQDLPNNFVCHEYGISDHNGIDIFYPPENPAHVSFSIMKRGNDTPNSIFADVKTLSSIMKDLNHEKIDLLKIDIEGSEYRVIKDFLNSRIYPGQILVEFHHRFPEIGWRKTKKVIRDLKNSGYCLFSVSPSMEEYCFISRELKATMEALK